MMVINQYEDGLATFRFWMYSYFLDVLLFQSISFLLIVLVADVPSVNFFRAPRELTEGIDRSR